MNSLKEDVYMVYTEKYTLVQKIKTIEMWG